MQVYQQKGTTKYTAVYRDENGRRIRKATGTSNTTEAEALAKKWEAEASESAARMAEQTKALESKARMEEFLAEYLGKKNLPKSPIPFADAMLTYAKHQKRKNLNSFQKSTRFRLETLTKHFGERMAGDIDKAAIRKYISDRVDAGVAPATAKREVNVLLAILNMAYEDGLLDAKPIAPRMAKMESRKKWLTVEQEEQLCRCASKRARKHLVPLIKLAIDTGGRRGELLGLDWKYVDLGNERLTFANDPELGIRTKNGSSRTVRVNARAIAILISLGPKESGPVFAIKGKPIGDIKHGFRSACEKAGLADFRFHDLRHTTASRLIQGGVSLFAVADFLGHKDVTMTKDYSHLADDYQAEIVKVFNQRDKADCHSSVITLADHNRSAA